MCNKCIKEIKNVYLQNNRFFNDISLNLFSIKSKNINILNSFMYLEIMCKNIQTASHARYSGPERNEA